MSLEPLNLTPIRHELMAQQPAQQPAPAKREIALPPALMNAFFSGHFKGAQMNRLTMDWAISILSADQELFNDLRRLRGRARTLAKNNHFASKFLREVEKNVIGDRGIIMQAKVKKQRGEGLLDKINQSIETAWCDWNDPSNCCVDGKLSWAAAQRFFIRCVAMDGEAFIRKVPLPGNTHLYALQFIDPDQVDPTFFIQRLPNGNEIRMGVEVDQYMRPVAYHIWDRHPSEYSSNPQARRRIPASEIIHAFIPMRVNQTRGIPWMAPAMFEMNMLGGYKEAEVIAARLGACKMGVVESQFGDEYTGDASLSQNNTDANLTPNMGRQLMAAEPGLIETLAPGLKLTTLNWDHPNASYEAFCKGALRGIASGLDVSYSTLGNDLEGVNFSSIRAGLLSERDTWRLLQQWTIDSFNKPVYRGWVPNSILAGGLELDAANLQQYMNSVEWHPRGWDWVDPLKDVTAASLAIQNGLSNHTIELGQSGLDLEDTWGQLATEKDLAAKLKLVLGTDVHGVADTASDYQKADPNNPNENEDSGSGNTPKPKSGGKKKKALAKLLRAFSACSDEEKQDELALEIATAILKK